MHSLSLPQILAPLQNKLISAMAITIASTRGGDVYVHMQLRSYVPQLSSQTMRRSPLHNFLNPNLIEIGMRHLFLLQSVCVFCGDVSLVRGREQFHC